MCCISQGKLGTPFFTKFRIKNKLNRVKHEMNWLKFRLNQFKPNWITNKSGQTLRFNLNWIAGKISKISKSLKHHQAQSAQTDWKNNFKKIQKCHFTKPAQSLRIAVKTIFLFVKNRCFKCVLWCYKKESQQKYQKSCFMCFF